jgi:hypothetical protein
MMQRYFLINPISGRYSNLGWHAVAAFVVAFKIREQRTRALSGEERKAARGGSLSVGGIHILSKKEH